MDRDGLRRLVSVRDNVLFRLPLDGDCIDGPTGLSRSSPLVLMHSVLTNFSP